MKNVKTNPKFILVIPVIIAIIALSYIGIKASSEEEIIITGLVETTQIDVASKIPGRVDSVYFAEGDFVKKGDILAKLESKEMDAKLEQTRGIMEAAKAKMDMAHKGTREEEKRGAEKLYLQAKHQYEFTAKTWERFQKLYDEKVISLQERDNMEFKYKAALDQMEAAKAKYDMALKGARNEEITASEALYHQAENAFNEASAYHQELIIKSPVAGEIDKMIVDPGEVIAGGYPIFSLIVPNESYVVLQIREDQMEKIQKGKLFDGIVPGLGNKEYRFKVTYIAPMADFATWKPTNQKGEFDLKTFEIRLKPEQSLKGLRPGMTVNIKL